VGLCNPTPIGEGGDIDLFLKIKAKNYIYILTILLEPLFFTFMK
jgi:hypothetical protein